MNDPINKIEAKYIPFKCPVCNGFRTVSFKNFLAELVMQGVLFN